MKKKSVEKVLDIYTLFVRETDALISLYANTRSFVQHIPEIHRAKTSLIDVLRSHIASLDDTKEDITSSSIESQEIIESHPFSSDYQYENPFGQYSESDESSEESSSSSSESITQVSRIGSEDKNLSQNPGPNSWTYLSSQPQQQTRTTTQGWDIFDNSTSDPSFSTSFQENFMNDSFVSVDTTESFEFRNDNMFGNQPQFNQPIQENISYDQRASSVKSLVDQLYNQQLNVTTENPFLIQEENNQDVGINPFETAPSGNPFAEKEQTQKSPQQSYNPFL